MSEPTRNEADNIKSAPNLTQTDYERLVEKIIEKIRLEIQTEAERTG